MVDFESVFPTSPEEEISKEINKIKGQLSTVSPLGISTQVETTLKRLTRKTFIGTGADGDAHFDGSSAVTGASLSGSTYTLTGDVNYNNVIVDNNVVVVGRQYLMFIKGELTNRGTIYANGAWW